jgi:hypothetical protein
MKNFLERNFWLGTSAERVTITPFENAYWIETNTGELWGFWFGVWHPLSGVGGPGAVLEGPGIDLVGAQVGLGGDTVLLYDNIGNPVAEFATVALALAASWSGQMVVLMPGTYIEDIIIPEGVCVTCFGNDSKISGSVVLGGHNSQIKGVVTELIGNSAGDLIGITGPPTGKGLINNCSITVTNNGAGQARGIEVDNGDLVSKNCDIIVTSNGGGNAYAMYGAGAGIGHSNNNLTEIYITAGGEAHGYIEVGSGDIYVTAGSVDADTSPVEV